MTDLGDIWVYLSANPLLNLTLTLIAFICGNYIYMKSKMNPLLNPVLIAVIIIVSILIVTSTSYESYFDGAQFVHFLLGPATVALAVPLYRQFEKVRQSALAIVASILTGSITAITSAIGVGYFLGASSNTLISLAPKSVTAPVAMGISEKLGGLPSLTAVLVIATGILGAMIGPFVLNTIGVKDWPARGLSLGTASHGIGTARAIQVNEVAGVFSGIAMGLNAIATAILLPIIWRLFF